METYVRWVEKLGSHVLVQRVMTNRAKATTLRRHGLANLQFRAMSIALVT